MHCIEIIRSDGRAHHLFEQAQRFLLNGAPLRIGKRQNQIDAVRIEADVAQARKLRLLEIVSGGYIGTGKIDQLKGRAQSVDMLARNGRVGIRVDGLNRFFHGLTRFFGPHLADVFIVARRINIARRRPRLPGAEAPPAANSTA